MQSVGRGKFGILAVFLFGICAMVIMGLYATYWISAKKNRKSEPVGQIQKDTITVYVPEPEPETPEPDDLANGIIKIRSLLLSRLIDGETPRFHDVFDRLEVAAKDNRIDRNRMALFPEILKMALIDNEIDSEELDLLLDNLESSIISPKRK